MANSLVITGSSRGLGRALAEAVLAAEISSCPQRVSPHN